MTRRPPQIRFAILFIDLYSHLKSPALGATGGLMLASWLRRISHYRSPRCCAQCCSVPRTPSQSCAQSSSANPSTHAERKAQSFPRPARNRLPPQSSIRTPCPVKKSKERFGPTRIWPTPTGPISVVGDSRASKGKFLPANTRRSGLHCQNQKRICKSSRNRSTAPTNS